VQLSVPWRANKQAKPFNSIPSINWLHPLSANLKFYHYDPGDGSCGVDLVKGKKSFVGNSTKPSVLNSPFGKALGGTTTTGTLNQKYTVDKDLTFAPSGLLSCSVGYFLKGTCAEGNTPFFGILTSGGTRRWCFQYPGSSTTTLGVTGSSTTAFGTATPTAGKFHSIAFANVTNASAVNIWHDGGRLLTTSAAPSMGTAAVGDQIWMLNDAFQASSSQAMPFYGGIWQRLLLADEALQLHNDPYCLLWYPEDDIFASLVGVSASPFTWLTMDDSHFRMPSSHSVREMIRHD